MEEQYTYENQKEMRCGFTTGTCGAAAALAAAALLFEGEELLKVSVTTPKGMAFQIEIAESVLENGAASCKVIKDAGDDPDVTNHAQVWASVTQAPEDMPEGDGNDERGEEAKKGGKWYEYRPEGEDGEEGRFSLFLKGGEGIGIVTREGLSCPPGMWAINPVPREMIFGQVAKVCQRCGVEGEVYITIASPGGEGLAQKTMNPQLGIEGGLSILGTSGVVEPMSERALLETLRLEIQQKAALGTKNLLVVPGNYGQRFVEDYMGMHLEDGVKCSNFVGNAIDMAAEAGMEGLLLVGHAGKLLKVAAGVMNTHSLVADGRMECLAAYGAACGASREMVCKILSCVTVDEALGILEEAEGLRDAVMEMAMDRIYACLRKRAGEGLLIEGILFTNDRGILGTTPGAIALVGKMASS